MSGQRKDDCNGRSFFKSNRFFEHDGQWFFLTREGTTEGPFASQAKAQLRLEVYIKVQCSAAGDDESGLSLAPLEP